jgi:large subunit ribosomal protein L22
MEAKAKARFARVSPRKARLVAANIKDKSVEEAVNTLTFTPKKAAKTLSKVLYSAIANAEQISGIDIDNLYVKQVRIDEGPTWKRIRPRAMGRATRILKRTSHITVIVDELE